MEDALKIDGVLMFSSNPDEPMIKGYGDPQVMIYGCHFHGRGTIWKDSWLTRPRLRKILILKKRLTRARMAFDWGKEYDKYDNIDTGIVMDR